MAVLGGGARKLCQPSLPSAPRPGRSARAASALRVSGWPDAPGPPAHSRRTFPCGSGTRAGPPWPCPHRRQFPWLPVLASLGHRASPGCLPPSWRPAARSGHLSTPLHAPAASAWLSPAWNWCPADAGVGGSHRAGHTGRQEGPCFQPAWSLGWEGRPWLRGSREQRAAACLASALPNVAET